MTTQPVPGRRVESHIDPSYAISSNAVTLHQADSGLPLTGEVPGFPPCLIQLSGEPRINPRGDDGSGLLPYPGCYESRPIVGVTVIVALALGGRFAVSLW